MRLLRRKKAEDAGQEPAGADATAVTAASADGEDAGAGEGQGPGDAAIAMVDAQEEADGQEDAAPPAPQPMAAGPPPEDDGDDRLPPSFYFEGLLKNDRPPSREELDRQAAADFQAAIAPAVGPLHELVPDASGPEDALRQLTERWEDPLPDPEGEAARGQDQFKRGPAETAVYYRIRRHFEIPRRRVGFGREAWRPPPGLARQATSDRARTRQALSSGRRSRRS